MKTDNDRATTGDTATPPGRLRLPLATVADVRRELARLYREGKAGKRDPAEVSKLANVLAILGRLIDAGEFERRIQLLEERNDASA